MQKKTKIRVKQGSGNIFRDLGFPNPEREHLKARLTLEIYLLIKDRGLTQTEAGHILRYPATSRFRSYAWAIRQLFCRTPYGLSHLARPGR